jgi:hypothetical protein
MTTNPKKITLSLGGNKISSAEKSKSKSSNPNSKRPFGAFKADSDDEGDADGQKHTAITHFDAAAGGAIHEDDKNKEKGPLVLQAQPNRDWVAAAAKVNRQKSGIPTADKGKESSGAAPDVINDKGMQYGLTVRGKQEGKAALDGAEGSKTTGSNGAGTGSETSGASTTTKEQLTEDEEALQALLGDKKSSLVLPPAQSEDEAFHASYSAAPNQASASEYAAVPVEEFGAALLRGMGWKDGEAIGRSHRGSDKPAFVPKEPQRRLPGLGIGATADKATMAEFGAWGKGAAGSKEKEVFVPVFYRHKVTGKELAVKEYDKLRDQPMLEENGRIEVSQERESKRYRRSYSRSISPQKQSGSDRRDRKDRDVDRERRDKRDRGVERPKYRESDRESERKNDRERRRDRDRRERDRDYESDRHRHRYRSRSRSNERRRHKDKDAGHDRDRDRDRRDRERRDYKERSRDDRKY